MHCSLNQNTFLFSLYKLIFLLTDVSDKNQFQNDVILALQEREKKQKVHDKMVIIAKNLKNFIVEDSEMDISLDQFSAQDLKVKLKQKLEQEHLSNLMETGTEYSEKFPKHLSEIWNTIVSVLEEEDFLEPFFLVKLFLSLLLFLMNHIPN